MLSELREFIRGSWALGPAWRVWMVLLLAANGVGPLLFLPQLTAVITLVASLTAVLVALALVRVQGRFTKLIGIIHAPWVPMLAVSLYMYPRGEDFDPYKLWLSSSIVLTIISLVIDITDVCRFLRETPRLCSGSDQIR